MDKKVPHQPDYKFWSKLDSWSFKDAALLLHGLDPLEFRQLRFNTREIPVSPELKEPYKTFLILKDANSQQQRPYHDGSVSPYFIMTIAIHKELSVPEELFEFLSVRHQREQENKQAADDAPQTSQQKQTSVSGDKELTTRERRSLLKSIGIMALLLTEDLKRASQFKLNDRTNAYKIAQAVLDKAHFLGIQPEGIKSLDRKITESLELLVEEEFERLD